MPDYKALLEEYKATKKLLWSEGKTRYEFVVSVTELPDEVRTNTAFFWVDHESGEVHLRRGVRKEQKFLCVGGSLGGQKMTEAEACPEYIVYNCAAFNRGQRDPKVPRAVLVHRQSLGAKPSPSRRKK